MHRNCFSFKKDWQYCLLIFLSLAPVGSFWLFECQGCDVRVNLILFWGVTKMTGNIFFTSFSYWLLLALIGYLSAKDVICMQTIDSIAEDRTLQVTLRSLFGSYLHSFSLGTIVWNSSFYRVRSLTVQAMLILQHQRIKTLSQGLIFHVQNCCLC